MVKILRFLPLLLVALVSGGCATAITNLTSSRQVRNDTGLYLIEFAWKTRDARILPETIKPCVMVGSECYEMKPTTLVSNRWEAVVPVSKDENTLNYRYRVDYEYRVFGGTEMNSRMTSAYRLLIVEK